MSKDEKKQQEILYRLNLYEQHLNQLRQQFQAVEEGIVELNSLNFGLDDIETSEGKEILALLGRGVFVKAKIVSNDLIVDVGNKNFVNKKVSETKEIIEEQIQKLENLKKELDEKIVEVEKEATEFLMEMQKEEQ